MTGLRIVNGTPERRISSSAASFARSYAVTGDGSSASVTTWSAAEPACAPMDDMKIRRLIVWRWQACAKLAVADTIGPCIVAAVDMAAMGNGRQMHHDVHACDERGPVNFLLQIGQFHPFHSGRVWSVVGLREAVRT